jgi:hypothetical protein
MLRSLSLLLPTLLLDSLLLPAQTTSEMAGVLERLDRLERQNRELAAEVQTLRAELASVRSDPPDQAAAAATPVEQRLDIQEQRIEEQAQSKVEASQRFPIRLTGMALFNAFLDSRQNGGSDYPTIASAPGPGHAGATVRQTIVGLEFRGPEAIWGGRVHGSVYMDFFSGTAPLAQTMRLRTGSIQIDWATRSVLAGVEKPIFNPREPSSLAQVGISPLTGAGNLWLWMPQIRVQQDFSLGPQSGLRAALGVVQTREAGPYAGSDPTGNLEASRPGLEGRFEYFHKFDDERRLEIAPGFHVSTTHAGGFSVPSQVFSTDWFFNPVRRLEFTGAFYKGQNVTPLGTGAIRQGFAVYNHAAEAIGSQGGWGQLTIHTHRRVDFHLFSGVQDDDDSELAAGAIGKNRVWGGNLYFRIAPNVLLAPEISQTRTNYIGQGTRINNHYDLALGYLF